MDYKPFTVLIVDDEVDILKALNRDLRGEPYKKVFANSGKQALEIIEGGEEVSVIITDMRMPGMNGLELLSYVSAMSPLTVMIVLTGYTQLPQVLATVNKVEVYKFLTKPWNIDTELKVYIKEAIDLYDARKSASFKLEFGEKKNSLYNSMLKDSFTKADQFSKGLDELLKVVNYHHILSVQEVRGAESLQVALEQMTDRMYYINSIFDYGRVGLKAFTCHELVSSIKQALNWDKWDEVVEASHSDDVQHYFGSMKSIVVLFVDYINTVLKAKADVLTLHIHGKPQEVVLDMVFKSDEPFIALYQSHGKFFQQLVKILGGDVAYVEEDDMKRLTVHIAVKQKD